MNKKFKIIRFKLTPATPFFFGKENSSDLGNKNDYFQTSLEYPQQSTLLGFVRHKILRDNDINLDSNNYKDDQNKAAQLIGLAGFNCNNDSCKDYSMVNSLSPCFIMDENDNYLWDRSKELIVNKNKSEELCLNDNSEGFEWDDSIRGKKIKYLNKHLFSLKLNSVNKTDILHKNDFVGIYKGGIKPGIKEDSFFIREYVNLYVKEEIATINDVVFSKTKSYAFGFMACVQQDCFISLLPDFMPMGKERSIFKVETKLIEESIELISDENIFQFNNQLQLNEVVSSSIVKCILLSDAKLNAEDLNKLGELTLIQITEQQRFRYIKRNTEKFFTAARPVKENKAFNLLAKGSVFFLKAENKLKIMKIFSKASDFRQIGYNYIKFINANTITI